MKALISALCLSTLAMANHHEVQVDGRSCNATTYLIQNVVGGQCRWSDQIMVGITSLDPLVIRCARLQVSCIANTQDPKDNER